MAHLRRLVRRPRVHPRLLAHQRLRLLLRAVVSVHLRRSALQPQEHTRRSARSQLRLLPQRAVDLAHLQHLEPRPQEHTRLSAHSQLWLPQRVDSAHLRRLVPRRRSRHRLLARSQWRRRREVLVPRRHLVPQQRREGLVRRPGRMPLETQQLPLRVVVPKFGSREFL